MGNRRLIGTMEEWQVRDWIGGERDVNGVYPDLAEGLEGLAH